MVSEGNKLSILGYHCSKNHGLILYIHGNYISYSLFKSGTFLLSRIVSFYFHIITDLLLE
jgi:hypothetical protein